MDEFRKYQKIRRLGTTETEGILDGECYIFPKLDGTNASVWVDESGKIRAASRNRELSHESDNAGFYAWAAKDEPLRRFFDKYPNLRLYGEWLVPHTLKTYKDGAWRRFYVFDVMDGDRFLHYDEYIDLLWDYDLDFIPTQAILSYPTEDQLTRELERNTLYIKDGEGVGEGIVIKRYGWRNRFGDEQWAKLVTNEFKERNNKTFGAPKKESGAIEPDIANGFITEALVEKEYAKIVNESGGWRSEYIPRLLGTVYYCLITEELWEVLKKHKMPTINFRRLSAASNDRVKELLPHLF